MRSYFIHFFTQVSSGKNSFRLYVELKLQSFLKFFTLDYWEAVRMEQSLESNRFGFLWGEIYLKIFQTLIVEEK